MATAHAAGAAKGAEIQQLLASLQTELRTAIAARDTLQNKVQGSQHLLADSSRAVNRELADLKQNKELLTENMERLQMEANNWRERQRKLTA